ncbi:MAG: ABC transporter permease [Muribaculaceae bacterium]|nr:ABC transporter permease [Muribaculaceae bacterium]
MRTTLAIAWRWLRSKKSHGAANKIAVVAVVGIAVAVAAIVCVLSVFNGFREVLSSRLDTLNPDGVVVSVRGRVIENGDSLAEELQKIQGVEKALPVVEEQALAIFGGREMPVRMRGVPQDDYKGMTGLDSIIIAGEPLILDGEVSASDSEEEEAFPEDYDNPEMSEGVLSIGTAMSLGNIMPGQRLMLFAPRRVGSINTANPLSSFVVDSLTVSGVFEAKQSDFDRDMVIVPLRMARDLMLYDTEAGKIELKFKNGVDPQRVITQIEKKVGDEYVVKDRLQMQSANFKMVSIEKWVTFLLLFFILVIASFNIVSTMTMFVIDKKKSISTLYALGMTSRRIGSVFGWESVMVTVAGSMIGVILGLGLCLLQQHYGLLKLAGEESTLVMSTYPVRVVWSDILILLIPVGLISAGTALTAAAYGRRQLRERDDSGERRR